MHIRGVVPAAQEGQGAAQSERVGLGFPWGRRAPAGGQSEVGLAQARGAVPAAQEGRRAWPNQAPSQGTRIPLHATIASCARTATHIP